MGGHPQSFSPRNASDSAGATREQVLGESTSNSPMVEASSVAGLENTNPSKPIEINSDILGDVPIFQEVDNVDRDRDRVIHGSSWVGFGPSPDPT